MHKNVEFDGDFKTIEKVAEKLDEKVFVKKVWKSFRLLYFLNELSYDLELDLKSEWNFACFDTVIDCVKNCFLVGIKAL